MDAVPLLITALNASTQCLGEAALKLLELREYALAGDLLKQVTQNVELIREITGA